MITLTDVSYDYQQTPILAHVNLTIKQGEFIFLTGSSGSGKSTLLKLLYREQTDYSGHITFNEKPLEKLSKFSLRQQMGIVFQDYGLLPTKTALENIQLAGEIRGLAPKQIEQIAKEQLSRVGLEGKEHHFPFQLSGGEQQRVAIARALFTKPPLLLADEPTGNLDKENAHHIMDLLYELHQQEGTTILVVTHAEDLVSRYPSRVVRLEKGMII